MSLLTLPRSSFSSPAALRIREAERAALARMAARAASEAPPAAESIIPPPSPGPLVEGPPDGPAGLPLALPSFWGGDCPVPTIHHIQWAVCQHYGVRRAELIGQRRQKPLVWARQVACYLAATLTGNSYPAIGRQFGNRDHTTIIAARNAVERRMAADPPVAAEVEAVRAKVMEGAA